MPVEGALDLDENLRKFINEETNAVILDCPVMISREKMPSGMEYIMIMPKVKDDYMKMYGFWYNQNKKVKEPSIISVNEDGEIIQTAKQPPKHTGGKKPYLMLMVNEIEKLREKGVKNIEELIGYVACLGKYIEWNTGRLIHKRKKTPLRYKDLQDIYKCSNKKLNKMIKQLKEHDLLYNTEEGYFISSKFIKKGKIKKQ